jgi:hypothetical protein
MSDGVEDEKGRSRVPIYAVELREIEDGAEVAIVRTPRHLGSGLLCEDVWTNRFSDREAAHHVVRVMRGRPDRSAVWARMADILGTEFLTGLIEAEVAEADRVAFEELQRRRRYVHRREEVAREANAFHVSLVVEGLPRIVASGGARRFMVLKLHTTVEALRVWDWVRWQKSSLPEWCAIIETRGAAALERAILDGMLAQEGSFRAAGLSAGGRRPLRHWRPAGGPGRDGPGDCGPEGDGEAHG